MTNPIHVFSAGLAAATVVVALLFSTALLLLRPSFAPLIAEAGLTSGTVPTWFGPVFGFGAISLAVATFAVSWKQRSFTVAWLLAVSGIIYMIPGLIALGVLNFPASLFLGPVISVIFGLLIFGLGMAKGITTTLQPAIRVANHSGGSGK